MTPDLETPDLTLLQQGPLKGPQLEMPHLEHFQKGDKHLLFTGTWHSTNTETRSHGIIQQTAFKHKPELLIVEGLETAKGLSPQIFDTNNPNYKQQYYRSEEPFHAAELARAHHVPFIGGEPTSAEVFRGLEDKGVSTKDTMAYLLLRMVPIWSRKGLVPDRASFEKLASGYLAGSAEFAHIAADNKLNLSEFTAWYGAHKAELGNKDVLAVTEKDCHHETSANATYFQKIGVMRDEMRNAHLVAVTADALKQHDRVMVVYGNAHQQVTTPVFTQMFGSKPVQEHLLLSELPTAVQTPPPATQPKAAMQPPAPRALPNLLRHTGIALLAAAGVAAMAAGFMPLAVTFLATGLLALGGSKMVEPPEQKLPEMATQALTSASPAISSVPERLQDMGRSDGKSWVNASNASKQLSVNAR